MPGESIRFFRSHNYSAHFSAFRIKIFNNSLLGKNKTGIKLVI